MIEKSPSVARPSTGVKRVPEPALVSSPPAPSRTTNLVIASPIAKSATRTGVVRSSFGVNGSRLPVANQRSRPVSMVSIMANGGKTGTSAPKSNGFPYDSCGGGFLPPKRKPTAA